MEKLPPLAPYQLAPMAFTIREVCEVSRVGRNLIYDAIQRGDLRAKKLGKKTLILRQDLERWLESLPHFAPEGGASDAEKPAHLGQALVETNAAA